MDNLKKTRFKNFHCETTLKKLHFLLLFPLFFLFCSGIFAQNITIHGKVTGTDGELIPGANVVLKGSLNGTVTNVDGEFTLDKVPNDAILVASFIGFKPTEISVNNKTVINITLSPDVIGLDEVVAIGYGTMRKADLTGSVSTMNSDDLVKTAAPNITSTLAGKLTGVITRQTSGRPGGDSPAFLIRGKSTFDPDNKGTNNPLVLVDGIERDFNRIDPNDIESITILKDAASASIYGSRGANGVILVTTKRGMETTPRITFSASYSSQKPTFRPAYMNAGEYAQYLNEAQVNIGQKPQFSEEEVQQFKDGTIPGTDWWSEMMNKSAPLYQYNVSLSGKNNKTGYFLSLGFIDQKGLFETATYKRYNIRSNIDTKITDNLSAFLNIDARNDNTNNSIIGEVKLYQTLETAIPTEPAYVPDSLRVPGDVMGLNFNGTAGSPMGEAMYSGYDRGENDIFESSFGLKYDFPFIKGLSAKFEFSYDLSYFKGKQFTLPYTLNYYTREAGLTSTVPSSSLITLNQRTEQRRRQTMQGSINYDHTFGDNKISALLLFEQMDYRYEYISAYREGFLTSTLDQIFAGSDINKDNNGGANENARQGYVGRITYNYKDKYLLQANARYDGSYNFPKNSRWGLFPAFSAGWRISEESFMDGLSFISNLKIRASWGQFGNDRVDPFYFLSGYEYANGYLVGGTYYTGIQSTGIPNKNITWETATSSNFGLEFGFFDGKLSGEVNYFYKKTEGILITRSASVPLTFGSKLPKENLGIVDNNGIESILRYQYSKGDFKYSIEGNFTYATSKVIYIDEPATVADRLKQTGRPFDSRFGYTALGLFQSQEEINASPVQDGNKNKSIHPGDIKYLDLNNDSIINDADRHYIGKGPTPEIIFGLNANVQYKHFSLTMNFQGATNYTRYQFINSFEKNYNSYKMIEDSWRVGNEDAKYPRLESNGRTANNSQYSTYWMNQGFYIKLRNIELSYTLDHNHFLDKIGMDEITLSLSGRNLLTIANADGFDPEGTDNRYPIMQSVSFGEYCFLN
jgi:TonB-linked SusC/RagA family outer membrane protein